VQSGGGQENTDKSITRVKISRKLYCINLSYGIENDQILSCTINLLTYGKKSDQGAYGTALLL